MPDLKWLRGHAEGKWIQQKLVPTKALRTFPCGRSDISSQLDDRSSQMKLLINWMLTIAIPHTRCLHQQTAPPSLDEARAYTPRMLFQLIGF